MSMALHSMKNKSTGFSANMLMFGREVIQPIDLMLGLSSQTAQDLPTWLKTLSHNLAEAQLDGIRLAELNCAKRGIMASKCFKYSVILDPLSIYEPNLPRLVSFLR